MGWSEAEAVYALQSIRKDADHVCLQKVSDRLVIKIREGFRSQIPFFALLSNL
jgi:hypothetical protein